MSNEQPEEAPKKSKLKFFIILFILLFLILGGVACYWWLNLRVPENITPNEEQAIEAVEETTEPADVAPEKKKKEEKKQENQTTKKTKLNIVTIPTVTINLADKDSIRYLKIGFDIELSTADAAENIEEQKAKVRDSIIILLSSKTYSELATTEGKIRIKNEIATRLNQILGVPRVVQIYFNEFVVN